FLGRELDFADKVEVDHREPDLRIEHRLERIEDLLLLLGLRDDRGRCFLCCFCFGLLFFCHRSSFPLSAVRARRRLTTRASAPATARWTSRAARRRSSHRRGW